MKQTLQKLATLAKADIVVENFPEGDEARGFYANGVIHLNARTVADYAWSYVAIHEAAHHLKAHNPEGFKVLEKYITNYLSRKGRNVDNMVKALQRSRAKHNEKLSYEDALEELICNALSDIATDENAMSAFLELNESERKTLISVLRDIAQKIRDWAKSLTGKEYRRLVTESEVLRHLANELNKQLKSVEGNAENTEVIKHSIIDDLVTDTGEHLGPAVLLDTDVFDGVSPRNWWRVLEQHLKNRINNSTAILPIIDESGNEVILEFANLNDTIKRNENKRRRVIDELIHPGGNIEKLSTIHIDELVLVSEAELEYHTQQTKNQWIDENGWLHRNAYVVNARNNVIYKITFDIAKAKDGRVILYALHGKTKRIGTADANSIANLQKAQRQNTYSEGNISQPEESVKKNSYADMVDLSADYDNAVEEYLRHKSRYNLNKVREIVNLAASKAMPDSVVRGESELLTKVYHGTEAESFNVFDKKRRGQTDSSLWGRGYYFTPDLEFATDFGENVRGFYLNITNPFIVTKVDAPASTIAVKFKSLGIPVNFDYSKIKAYEFAGAFGNQRFTDVLQEHGYDGVIVEDFEFVAFDQNQMKLADAITYDDNGDVIPLSERFDSGTNDIRYSRNDFSVDYSDLSVLDDEQIDAYNKRGWARGLFTSEDIALLNRRLGEIYHENSQYVRTTLADGTVVLDLNNKVLLVSGEFGDESIEGVLTINATSETDAELYKEDFYAYTEGTRLDKESYGERCKIAQDVYGETLIRYYDSIDYRYQKSQYDSGDRATLPDYWQNYGYTTGKQNGRRFPAGPEGGVPGTSRIRPDKRKNSYGDDDFNLWGLLDPEEETPETTERSELLEGFVQTAGTLLEKTRSIPLEDGRVRRIANTVIRRFTMDFNSINLQLIIKTGSA